MGSLAAHPKHLSQVGVSEAEGDVGDVQAFGGSLGLGVAIGQRHQRQRPRSHLLARGPRLLDLGRLVWLHLGRGGGVRKGQGLSLQILQFLLFDWVTVWNAFIYSSF